MAAVEVLTERLVLRQWRADDLAPWAALNDDPEVMAHFPGRLTREGSDAFAGRAREAIAEQGWGLWAVELRDPGAFVGMVGLQRPTFMPGVEVGWRLARPYWGLGLATEAARAAVAYGFGTLELPEIIAMTTPSNLRSQAVMRRLGMTRDPAADFDHPRVPSGPLRRHILFRLARPSGPA